MHIAYEALPALSPETWMLWLDGAHAPWFNMAADHVLLEHAAVFAKPVLRLYKWDRPAVSFGRSQHYPRDIQDGCSIVRRPTGGGVVWHEGDLTYGVVMPAGHILAQLDVPGSYRFFHEAILAQLDDAAFLRSEKKDSVDPRTMQCFKSPSKFDIIGLSGVKYAGAAQLRNGGGVLTQGSVRLEAAAGDWDRMKAKMLRAFECAAHARYETWSPDAGFIAQIEAKAAAQYERRVWNEDGALPDASHQFALWPENKGTAHAEIAPYPEIPEQ